MNSRRDIPAANFVMHVTHCQRNLTLCKKCGEPVPTSQQEEHFEEYHTEVGVSQRVKNWSILIVCFFELIMSAVNGKNLWGSLVVPIMYSLNDFSHFLRYSTCPLKQPWRQSSPLNVCSRFFHPFPPILVFNNLPGLAYRWNQYGYKTVLLMCHCFTGKMWLWWTCGKNEPWGTQG